MYDSNMCASEVTLAKVAKAPQSQMLTRNSKCYMFVGRQNRHIRTRKDATFGVHAQVHFGNVDSGEIVSICFCHQNPRANKVSEL